MKYFATFSSGSSFSASPYEYADMKEAVKDITAICKGTTSDRCDWSVKNEDGCIVAAGYTKNNRNHNQPELVGTIL